MTAKKIAPQSIIGQAGVNLVERVVLQMKYAWRPTSIFDAGIDGEIEVCDPVTGEATNTFIKVQVKSTTQPFQAETPDLFEYSCEQKDLDYWLRGNAPVILIVCRPDTDEAYWVSIKDYFEELTTLKTSKVSFYKDRNRFDVTCASALKQLALPKDSGIYFAPLRKAEKLYTNLLKVESFAARIYMAETDYRERKDIWEKFKTMGVTAEQEWILTNRRLLSFHNLETPPFNAICDLGTLENFDTNEWADTEDEDKKREFVQLLNRCLRERAWLLGLRFYSDKRRAYYYFPATKNLKTRQVRYQSIKFRVKREVFKQYGKQSDPTKLAYCRHSAFKGYFLRLDETWYLEITPTYHFTRNGKDEDGFSAEHLKGIKRLERNPAVLGQLLMWADFLRRPVYLPGSIFVSEYPFLRFGKLAMVDIDASLPDDIWYQAEEGGDAQSMNAQENQLTLLGL